MPAYFPVLSEIAMPATPNDYPSARDLMDALRFLPEEGQIWLGEQRMLLMSLQASAFFRNELVTTLGIERARGVFIRLGYYCLLYTSPSPRD